MCWGAQKNARRETRNAGRKTVAQARILTYQTQSYPYNSELNCYLKPRNEAHGCDRRRVLLDTEGKEHPCYMGNQVPCGYQDSL